MNYYFNISINGKFFAKVDMNVHMRDTAFMFADILRKKFPKEEGYKVVIVREETISEDIG